MTDHPLLCAWCGRRFGARQTGGHDQRFCRPFCRHALHATVRRWALAEVAAGRLSLAAIKTGLPATRALATGVISAAPAPEPREKPPCCWAGF